MSSTDCLVLKLEEFSDGEIDTTLFVLYSINDGQFLVRGKRSDINGKPESIPYSFNCKYAEDLADFISFAICEKNKWHYTLYNYDNLPSDPEEIKYDYLKDLDGDREYEIAGYDNKNYSKEFLLKTLRMLRNVFNYY